MRAAVDYPDCKRAAASRSDRLSQGNTTPIASPSATQSTALQASEASKKLEAKSSYSYGPSGFGAPTKCGATISATPSATSQGRRRVVVHSHSPVAVAAAV